MKYDHKFEVTPNDVKSAVKFTTFVYHSILVKEINMALDEVIESYSNTVKENILDEDKLVTCITISKDLCIHINNSKKLLQSVVQDIRKKQPKTKLNVNYIVSGFLGDNKAQTKVCTEDDLDNIKKSFKIVFYDHIYSVCKGSSGVDNASYIMLTKFDDYNICPGLIKSSECIKRSTTEIGNLKTCSQEQIITETKPLVTPAKKSKQVTSNDSKELKTNEVTKNGIKEGETKTNPVKSEPITPKPDSTSIKPGTNKTNGNKTQKGIAGFFSKPNIGNNKKVSKDSKEIKIENVSIETKIENVSEEIRIENIPKETKIEKVSKETFNEKNNSKKTTEVEEEIMEVDVKPETVTEKKKLIKKESKSNNKDELLNKIKKSSKVDKSRKRVLHVSDSDSDTENDPFVDKLNSNVDSMDLSDDEIPPTPAASYVKINSGIVNPKKRRKIVDKTYTDEDGYILTKKEEVYESCSENEEEVRLNTKVKVEKMESPVKLNTKVKKEKIESPVKKNSPKSKKKISPPQKGKQATLTNFFKKV